MKKDEKQLDVEDTTKSIIPVISTKEQDPEIVKR